MAQWDTILTNFKNFMEVTVGGWTNIPSIDLTTPAGKPITTWDHSYTIMMNGMPNPLEFISQEIFIKYNVRLQIAFELNEHNELTDYNSAIGEVEDIIVNRLNILTYQGTLIDIVHQNTSPFIFINGKADERFAVMNIDFLVTVARSF